MLKLKELKNIIEIYKKEFDISEGMHKKHITGMINHYTYIYRDTIKTALYLENKVKED